MSQVVVKMKDISVFLFIVIARFLRKWLIDFNKISSYEIIELIEILIEIVINKWTLILKLRASLFFIVINKAE